jgi:hypothetical protein
MASVSHCTMSESLIVRKAFVTLAGSNHAQLVEFYQQFLGIAPQPFTPNVYAEFQLPGLCLGIFRPSRNHGDEFNHSTQAGMSICLEVATLESAIARLTNLGYPPPGPIILAAHGREIYAYDPDENRLILHQSHSPSDAIA